ncbi:sensor histidine kinase [Aliikangiella maris]|uniref:ATP-binding protein n=2 Tax=Aliikangiella maris TaxID=3162458 RepID=A0ABV3MMW8_9GAMM
MLSEQLTATSDHVPKVISDWQLSAIPKWFWALVLLISLSPILISSGINFSSSESVILFDSVIQQKNIKQQFLNDQLYVALQGGMYYALVEWSAVIIAVLCGLMAFSHFNINRDISGPLIGLILFYSGIMDAIHALAATRFMTVNASSESLILFSWAISRSFNTLLLLIGGMILLKVKSKNTTFTNRGLLLFALLLSVIIGCIYYWMTTSNSLPKTQFEQSLIHQSYDLIPLVGYCLCVPLFYQVCQKKMNFVTGFLLVGCIPLILSECYMVFGSKNLYDHYFNSAHLLKVFSYLLPFIGYLLDHRRILLQQQHQQKKLTSLNLRLADKQTELETINNVLPVGLMQVNRHGIIVSANNYVHQVLHYPAGSLIGKSVEILVPDYAKDVHVSLRQSFQKKSETRQMAKDVDSLYGKTQDGQTVPLEIGLASIVLDGEKQVLVSLIDIHERKQMLEALKNKNETMEQAITSLRRSNEQLERFAYICSHDLQEPIRMVESFSQMLQHKLGPQLDGKNKEYLHYIIDGASRARAMITDILLYCRLEQPVMNKTQINLQEICEQVHRTLEINLKEKNATFTWQENLPTLIAVQTQLFQLILNLVNNGIKFNHDEQPQVYLYVEKMLKKEQGNDYWKICVKDNGIGINPRDHKKIFNIFERLNAKADFSGTGIGLANCQKIVEQHDATISVDSQEGKGSVFVIHWPCKNIETREQQSSLEV